jgi:hypothetical protein
MALAQHYGVPTRLLDWTRQPYIAAFFAAESAKKLLDDRKCDFAECLVVWAFYFPDLGRQDDEVRKYAPISVVTAPKATNTNMKAQQGVFTLLNTTYLRDFTSPEYYGEESWLYRLIANPEMKYLKDTKGDYPPLDVFLNNLALAEYPLCVDLVYDSNVKRLISNCRFQKFTLPISEAPQLLHLLAKFDITPSVVYPGYHSISSDLKIQNYWE